MGSTITGLTAVFSDADEKQMINDLQNEQVGMALVIFSPITTLGKIVDVLKQKETDLVYLALPNQNIGDEGAQLLSEMLSKNRMLEHLNVQNCQITSQGLEYLITGLRSNMVTQTGMDGKVLKLPVLGVLDLSHNPGLFNEKGGELIGNYLASSVTNTEVELMNPTTCFLMRKDNEGDELQYTAFMNKLMLALHWTPRIGRHILLYGLTPSMIEAIYDCKHSLHMEIKYAIRCGNISHIWHFVLDQVYQTCLHPLESIFFYLKEMK